MFRFFLKVQNAVASGMTGYLALMSIADGMQELEKPFNRK